MNELATILTTQITLAKVVETLAHRLGRDDLEQVAHQCLEQFQAALETIEEKST